MQYGKLIPEYSAYPNRAGKRSFWLTSDTEELFTENLNHPVNKRRLEEGGWINTTIEYSINTYGFRSPEFYAKGGIMFLGCSFTVGIGLPVQQTFPYIVADKLNWPFYNLGVGGGSNDSTYRLGSYWIPKLKPSIVVLVCPSAERVEIINHNKHGVNIIPQDIPTKYEPFYLDWIDNEYNQRLNMEKNVLAIDSVCRKNDSTFVLVDSALDLLTNVPEWDNARDLMHPGPKANNYAAEKILNLI